ncbi:MAG: NAD(P)/FAD-dependent oxidoreductase [Pleurocapsa sp. MO_192.B19]|nr:NAD(P)/FAD-dependent oxidoreductase [Pleurocapsa sp. MO_192.B19]
MKLSRHKFDVAIIGSGIAGSCLGAILARHDLKVIIFEAKSHPRFAIGESMILETSEILRAMAELYSVPELAYFSSENYFSHIGTSHGVKRHFSYLHHEENQPQNPAHLLQAVIPKQPYGHELHLYRQDSDYFLMTTAIRYGATVLQNTIVKDVEIDSARVRVITEQEDYFEANYIVDAGGFRSLLANKFDLREYNLQTHSRAIFTHMVNVPCYHHTGTSQTEFGVPFRVSEGTLHHIFNGGWLWIISFNNHPQATNPLCSVGLMLDPRIHPIRKNLSPEEEFYSFITKFPSLQSQLQSAKTVRSWTRTDRIQYGSKKIIGDRFCLLGHAAGFVDPLFSKGLYTSLSSVSLLANLLLEAKKTNDYDPAKFQPLEDFTLTFLKNNDRLIANAYRTFSYYSLWSLYSVLWLLGAYCELLKLTTMRASTINREGYYRQLQNLKLVGGGFAEFEILQEQIYTILENTNFKNKEECDLAVNEIESLYSQLEWMPYSFRQILNGKNHLPASKIRPSIFRREGEFLGMGAYRQHFFGDLNLGSLVKLFWQEKSKYSILTLNLQRKGYLSFGK